MLIRILAVSAAMIGTATTAAARDYVLDTTPDPTPDNQVVFSITVPYELRDVHPDATLFAMVCEISIGLPRNAEGTLFSFSNFRSDAQRVDLTGVPAADDGFRDVSGEFTFTIPIPAEDASNLLRDDTRGRYDCDAVMTDRTDLSIGVITVSGDISDDASKPYWARGVGSGSTGAAVSGRILLEAAPASESSGVPSVEGLRAPSTIEPTPFIRPPPLPRP